MKSIGVLKTCEFKTNAHNARALELMIPCHNNAATCYIKRKNYGDARLLTENVREREREREHGIEATRRSGTVCLSAASTRSDTTIPGPKPGHLLNVAKKTRSCWSSSGPCN